MSGTGTATGNIVVPGYNPANLVPGIFAAFDATNANTSPGQNQQTLIFGQMHGTSKTFTANIPVLITSTAAAIAAAGNNGCQLAREIARYAQDDPTGTVYVMPLLDDPGGTNTTVVTTLGGTAAVAGTLSLEVGGQLVSVGVNVGDTGTVVATNAAQAVNTQYGVPATAAATTGVLTLTAVNAGVDAGDLDVRLNYLGAAAGQALPTGLTASAFAVTPGTVNPQLATALANLGTTNFDFIVFPYTDTASLNLLSAALSQQTGRWSLSQQLYGTAFIAKRGTVSARTTFGLARDDQFISALGFYDSPTPAYEWAASFAAVCAASLRANPAIPLRDLAMSVLAPPPASQDTPPSQQVLLSDGLSTFYVSGGVVYLQRARSLYTTNPQGFPDNSWRDTNTPYELMACIRQFTSSLSSQFQRKILVADGTNIAGGSSQVTSQTILAAANAIYQTLCDQGWAQASDVFIQNSRGQNQGNGVVALYLPINVANQLWDITIDAQFLKS
jgi:phage tail sheath gpL-like